MLYAQQKVALAVVCPEFAGREESTPHLQAVQEGATVEAPQALPFWFDGAAVLDAICCMLRLPVI